MPSTSVADNTRVIGRPDGGNGLQRQSGIFYDSSCSSPRRIVIVIFRDYDTEASFWVSQQAPPGHPLASLALNEIIASSASTQNSSRNSIGMICVRAARAAGFRPAAAALAVSAACRRIITSESSEHCLSQVPPGAALQPHRVNTLICRWERGQSCRGR